MRSFFGTDGIRGKANTAPMDSETVMRLGRAAAHVMRRTEGRHRILIGKDTRVSGYMLEQALASGIASMGVDVLLCGPIPTPAIAYLTKSMRADAGVMISASHNPYEDNGIKFFGADGFKLPDEREQEIERLMEPGHLDELRAVPDLIGKAFRVEDAIGRYVVFLRSALDRKTDFDGLKVIVDAANGAAYRVAPQVFLELGATVFATGDRPDGKNINAKCGSLYPQHIAQLTLEHNAHLGVALDGDADRVIFCDEKGQVFDGDQILAMLALAFKKRGMLRGDGVVATTMSNFGLEKMLSGNGLKLYRADVGDRYVLQEMLAKGANLGGEQSGHIISLDHNTTGDGVLTALLVMEELIRSGKPLSEYKDLFSRYPQILVNVPVKVKKPFAEIPAITAALKQSEERIKGTGRVVLRYSGTENKARVMVECEDKVVCDDVANGLSEILKRELGSVPA